MNKNYEFKNEKLNNETNKETNEKLNIGDEKPEESKLAKDIRNILYGII